MGFIHKLIILLIVLSLNVAAVTYDFEVLENGETTVLVGLERETVYVSLPPDVGNPQITNGKYNILKEGIEASAGNGTAEITYTSSFHTRKENGIWFFDGYVPNASTTVLTLPKEVQVVQSIPRSRITKDEQLHLTWNNLSSVNITVSYVRIIEPVEQETNSGFSGSGIIALVFLVALSVAYYYFSKPKKKKVRSTRNAQNNVIKAANVNEARVMKILLKHKGQMKRNKLEKESQLSKSSLASTLKNLEKKNIAKIDRSSHVHYITLTNWFKKLK